MSELSDKELEQAAAEAGISAGELRAALAHRESGVVVENTSGPTKIKSHGFVQARVAAPPSQALACAHRIFSQQIGYIPTRGEDGSIRYVIEETGLAYQLSSESDGTHSGSVARVDIDLSEVHKRILKVVVPCTVGLVLITGLLGLEMLILTSLVCVVTFSIAWQIRKHRDRKEAKVLGQALLDRVVQEALPGSTSQLGLKGSSGG